MACLAIAIQPPKPAFIESVRAPIKIQVCSTVDRSFLLFNTTISSVYVFPQAVDNYHAGAPIPEAKVEIFRVDTTLTLHDTGSEKAVEEDEDYDVIVLSPPRLHQKSLRQHPLTSSGSSVRALRSRTLSGQMDIAEEVRLHDWLLKILPPESIRRLMAIGRVTSFDTLQKLTDGSLRPYLDSPDERKSLLDGKESVFDPNESSKDSSLFHFMWHGRCCRPPLAGFFRER